MLENEDLLITSSSGEPSLFADAPSPVSLLADNTPSQDTPPPGCVDLSFLEEALLGSPEGGGPPEVGQGGSVGAEEEACDILQQSLQEADITEQTLALEAGLAPPGEALSLYPPGTVLAPAASHFLSKPLSIPPLPAMPRDTQAAVEPPQPSLLAVGPGCPSLKPAAPQMMGLLPGTVFPAPPPDTSFSLSPAQGSGMLIQKALPSLTGRPLLAPTLRATAAHGILLPRGPLPIQPKLPISIQPRLVQISPKPPGQKTSPGLTFVPGTAPPNILLSPSLGPKQQPPAPSLSKPLSLQLLNQGGSIVIQPPGLLQGHNQFLLPGQTPVTVSQSGSIARPLLTTSSPQGPPVRAGAPPSGQLVDGAQILTASSRQLNFSPVFTTPTGQLAVRQGALLSGPLQLQSAPPTVFQMPAQLAGAYPPQGQGQGQRGTLLHSAALGNQITLINSPAMLAPDLASISIVNGPSVMQGLPFAPQAQQPIPAVQEKQLNLPQTPVLLLPDRPGPEERGPVEEPFLRLSRQQHVLQHAPQPPPPVELQMPPPVVTLLQPLPEAPLPLDPTAPLSKHLMPQMEGQQALKEVPSLPPQKQGLLHQMHQQALELPSPPMDNLAGTLPTQMSPPSSPPANQREATTPSLPAIGQTVTPFPVTANRTVVTTPTHPGPEQTGTMLSLIGQTSLATPPGSFPSPPGGQAGALPRTGLSKAGAQARPVTPGGVVPSPLPVGLSAQLQPVPLPAPMGPRVQNETPIQQRAQESAAALAVDSNMFGFGLCPSSPKIQGPQIPAPHAHRQQVPEALVQAVMQPRTQVPTCVETEREERLTLAMRRHRFQQQLCLDHGVVSNPDTHSPFLSLEDAVRRVLPYHTCAGYLPSQAGFLTGVLLKRTKDMFNKYRQLLLGEAQQVSPSAEMVMLERLFLQAERGVLVEERRKARLDPDSFLSSLRKPAPGSHGAPPSTASSFLQSGSPPSSPSWALLSDRPPGLKTYRSSSRGALKLTIKHESGSRKVVHNSVCDAAFTTPSYHKQEGAGKLTNGGGVPSRTGSELWDAPRLQSGHPPPSAGPRPQATSEESQIPKHSGRIAEAQTAAESRITSDPMTVAEPPAAAPEPPAPDPVLCPPEPKRPRSDPHQGQPSPLPPPEDNTLSEHLQSAIDSILELQRLQGPTALQGRGPQDGRGTSVLEQAVSSILEGHL
ncbi:hypothetical protein AAFF_G00387000 [Aldrovandia affinis]|uniref:GLTSCR protein conserved domain-containing protein n=1 Tax=Aldrovandia affinis TaxID=143900 RepID=A0AAD7SEW7_9TELE|nr:hypothetical protein AAFF_G00387000 [Aldrovandia affinis]